MMLLGEAPRLPQGSVTSVANSSCGNLSREKQPRSVV